MKRRLALLITGLFVACAASGAAAATLAFPGLPQILPVPQVGPLGSGGGGSGPPSSPPAPVHSCPHLLRQRLPGLHVHFRRLHLRHLADSFRANMFGIAAGGLIQKESCPALERDLNDDAAVHARWLRIDINWAEIQDAGPGKYDWSRIDRVVREATARGMRVLGGIIYTPWWARPRGTDATYGPTPDAYATFAGAAAQHYGRMGVRAFEIWNEPNSPAFWKPAPDPAAYTAVLKAAYRAIKKSDPAATVVTGGTAPAPTEPGSYNPVDFVKGIYAAGGRGYFDAVGHHPYCWPLLPGASKPWSAWYQMDSGASSLRSLMVANGDGAKKIWATEFGAPTDGPTGSFVSPTRQATMLIKAYKLFAGYSWAGPLFFYSGRDLGTTSNTNQNFFGLTTYDFLPKPAYGAYLAASSAVSQLVHRRGRHHHHHRHGHK